MKKISFIGLLILTIVIHGCENDYKSKYCKNQLKLIEPNKELNLFEFKLDSKPDSIINLIENKLDVDICDKVTSFGIQLENLKIKAFVFGECKVTFLHKLSSNEIDLNKNGDILIQTPNTYDGFIVTKIDSIPNWFEKNYPIKHNLHSNVIRLSWGKDVNRKLVKKTIKNIADGYLLSLNKKSIISFNKELCELSEKETDKLKTEDPFELELRSVSSSKHIVEIESEE